MCIHQCLKNQEYLYFLCKISHELSFENLDISVVIKQCHYDKTVYVIIITRANVIVNHINIV